MVKTTLQLLSLSLPACLVALLAPACNQTEALPYSKFVELKINSKGGFVSEELGIHGNWYVYGDAYGNPSSCMYVGKHDESVCSTVAYPVKPLPGIEFPNEGGKMCISGVVAQVLPCCNKQELEAGKSGCSGINSINCPEEGKDDHSSMWGAGMGFDLGLTLKDGPEPQRDYDAISNRKVWNAAEYDVVGIAFELEWHAEQKPPLRIEFPIRLNEDITLPQGQGTVRLDSFGDPDPIAGGEKLPKGASTEEHPYGSPFWQLPGETDWKRSPVQSGTNIIRWENVFAPPENENKYMDDAPFLGEQLLGIQFHVIPDNEEPLEATPFSFCISNFRFLTE